MSVRADAETLRQIPIFADCDSVHLQVLAFASERETFVAGAPVIKQGDKAKAAHLILNGFVEIRQRHGLEFRQVATAGPGSLLGEIAMIGRTQYAVTATATTPVVTARIDHILFMRVANEYPEFGETVFNTLARRLDAASIDFEGARTKLMRAKSFGDL
jgi:CRP-like cAMP-binding protein